MRQSGNLSRAEWRSAVLGKIDPQHTALLVIDLQRDFCSEDGALAALGSDVAPCRSVASRVSQFLTLVRHKVALVAFFQLVYDPRMMSESQRERLIRNGRPVICDPETSGIELFVQPSPNDLVFAKHHYSAFSNEQFNRVLKERSITTIVVVGVDTHICVEGTVRDGYDLGYRVVVLSDLVATRTSELNRHQNSLELLERYFAITLPSDKFLSLLTDRAIGAG